MNKQASPFSIYVLWDSNFDDGISYANQIYDTYCRHRDTPTLGGVGIPVFYINENTPFPNEISNVSVFFLLVDEQMIFNKERWTPYVEQVLSLGKHCVPVSFSQRAFNAFVGLKYINFIREDNTRLTKFKLTVSHIIYKQIYNISESKQIDVSLFLSHTKRDKDKKGLEIANRITKYLSDENSPIKTFFDERDIEFGSRFDQKIEDGIASSTIVILLTDKFASSEWCRQEVLLAKRLRRPIVVLDFLEEGETRSFPYLGNTKTMRFSSNINYFEFIHEILAESIRIKYFAIYSRYLLETFDVAWKAVDYLPYPPELLTDIYATAKLIVYPAPPISNEELRILQDASNRKYITPVLFSISYNRYNHLMKDTVVGFSLSESDTILARSDMYYKFQDVIVGMAKYFFSCGSIISYNGKIGYLNSNYFNIFTGLAAGYNERADDDQEKKRLRYYYYKEENIPIETINEYAEYADMIQLSKRDYDEYALADAGLSFEYTFIRSIVASHTQIRIILGGKEAGYLGILPGVLEEFLFAVKYHQSIYLLGAFGGLAKSIVYAIQNGMSLIKFITNYAGNYTEDQIFIHLKEASLSELLVLPKLSIKILNNGLTKEENLELFTTSNYTLATSIILKGYKRYLSKKQ